MAAEHADCIFAVTNTLEEGKAFYADLKRRLPKYGRTEDSLRILPGCTAFVGRTAAEADELFEELQALIPPSVGVPYLSKLVEMDLSPFPLDGPMPDLSGDTIAIASFRKAIAEMARRENLTIRQTYERILPSMGHIVFRGSPTQVADQMEEWYRGKACDGFNVGMPVMPRCLRNFVDLVIPELQRRGLFRKEYTGSTLRERMGLPLPQSRNFAPAPMVAAQ